MKYTQSTNKKFSLYLFELCGSVPFLVGMMMIAAVIEAALWFEFTQFPTELELAHKNEQSRYLNVVNTRFEANQL